MLLHYITDTELIASGPERLYEQSWEELILAIGI